MQANLPLLQRELLHCARLNRQSPAQYLSSNEQFLFDHAGISSASSERGNGSGSSAPAAADRGSRDTGAVSPPESRPPVGQSTPSSGASEGGGGQNGTKRKLTRSECVFVELSLFKSLWFCLNLFPFICFDNTIFIFLRLH